MIRGLYTAVSGLITQEAKQDVITNNLANANTTGYKADDIAVKQFREVLLQNYDGGNGSKPVRQELGSISLGSRIDETKTYFTQGMLNQTNKDMDFAIDGRGFFSVQRGNNTYYTRDGHFHVNAQGYLVNDSGDRVLGRNSTTGAVEPIIVNNDKIKSDDNNNVFVNDRLAYTFNTADFQDYNALKKVGDNLYEGQAPINGNVHVKQGFIEKSNVNIVNEMVNMMTVMRSFETNQKMVQIIDETLNKAANEVGSVR